MVRIVRTGGFLEVSFPYHPQVVLNFKAAVPVRIWNKERKVWQVPIFCSPHVLKFFRGAIIEDVEGGRPLFRDLQPSQWPPAERKWGCELMGFQVEGVKRISELDSALLADDPGLGKTIQAIAWASNRRVPGRNVVVVPAVLKWHWAREIERMLDRPKVLVLDKASSWPTIRNHEWEWLVVSYELLSRPQVYEAVKAELVAHFILDEAHYIKNTATQRAKAAIRLARRAKRVLAVTGTPIMNRPIELVGTLRALGRMAPDAESLFKYRFCAPKNNGFRWVFEGASNTAELHRILKPFMVRRLKSEVIKELPEKRYTDIVVDLEDFANYSTHESHLIGMMRERRLTPAELNTRLFSLRRIAALGKAPSALEILQERDLPGLATVVFCSHVEPLKWLSERLPSSVLLTGETPPHKRDDEIRRFQDGTVRFALCSTMAMGTGVTLTRADVCYFLDLPWNPAAKQQAEDRVHRIGQTGNVQVVHLLGRNTIDERMARLMLDKRNVIDSVVDGIESVDAPEASMLEALGAEYKRESPW
jgi:SWI/SNF-related matrix-associated actin-dependent regulator 1 of chromatin subfamily A